jgi:tripartite-type tricarboxylate transporter receptor subunit TctC
LDALPDVPTIADSIPGFEASGWCGLLAPKNTPSEIVELLNKEVNGGLAERKIKTQLADTGVVPFVSSPREFSKFIADETEKWSKVIRAARIKLE